MFSSSPTINTAGNSSPFALCIVISDTLLSAASSSLSRSVRSETSCRKSERCVSCSCPSSRRVSTKSCMASRNSLKLSCRESPSGVESPYISATMPLSFTIFCPSVWASAVSISNANDSISEQKACNFPAVALLTSSM